MSRSETLPLTESTHLCDPPHKDHVLDLYLNVFVFEMGSVMFHKYPFSRLSWIVGAVLCFSILGCGTREPSSSAAPPNLSAGGWSYEGQDGSGRVYVGSEICPDGRNRYIVEFSLHSRKGTLRRESCAQVRPPDSPLIIAESDLIYDSALVETGYYPTTIQYRNEPLVRVD